MAAKRFGAVLSNNKGGAYTAVKVFKNSEGKVRAVLTNNVDRFVACDADDPDEVMAQAAAWSRQHNATILNYAEVFNEAWGGVEQYYFRGL